MSADAITPQFQNVRYGPHERNVMDVFPAHGDGPRPFFVYVHGGGFRSGDKANAPAVLRDGCLRAGIAFVAIHYRLSQTDPYPAAMLDSVRALQFIRSRAEEWNLDPARAAIGGGSAGAGISFWIGFRPDFADPASADPVCRESTRVTCIAAWNAQSSYDAHFIREHIAGPAWRHEALQQFFRLTPDQFGTPHALRIYREVHAFNYVSKDAPPVFLWYKYRNEDSSGSAGHGIHHPTFGMMLRERMTALGVECVLRLREDFPTASDAEAQDAAFREMAEWLKGHLRP